MKKREKDSVLIIDDEPANIIALTNIMKPHYNVYAVKNGTAALKTAIEVLPDVILLDVLMPDMDGYAVIAELKNNEITRNIPVIFVTGLDNNDAEKKGLALGAADYIVKPFNPDIVTLRVHNQLIIVNHTRALDERIRQQVLMTKISHGFLTDSYVDSIFSNTLRMVGEFMDIAQVLLFKYETNDNIVICQNEWIKPELQLQTRIGSKLNLNKMSVSMINKLLAGNEKYLCFHSNDPIFKAAMRPYRKHFHNYISTPIFIKGKLCAILDFSREDDGRKWSESEINLAVLVSSIFSGVFERDAMERQFSIVENAPNIVLSITTDVVVEYANPALTSIIGCTKAELIANGLGVIFDENTLADIKDNLIPIAMCGGTASFENNIACKDGKKRIMMVSLFQTGKNNLGMILRDLTETRNLQTSLVAAKEQAERSSRTKSEFLSRMSHEMRTPMNAIIGKMQLAAIRGIPDDLKETFDEINIASQHLLSLIDDVLDISDMEYEMFKLFDSVFDTNAMFKDILQTASHNASVKQQSFLFNVDPAMPASLRGDEKRLKQVIVNLLSNAIKFTPERGQIRFDARVFNKKNDKSGSITLQIVVTDNGIGISEEQRKKLFNTFEQADGSLSRQYDGIGIGLALSRRIIEMMGGTIRVDSTSGMGSTFSFELDFDAADMSLVDDIERPTFEGEVLVCEDNAMNQQVICEHLALVGLKTAVAQDGKKGVEMVKNRVQQGKKQFDLVFMDIHMPVMDGLEATAKILDFDAGLPIVAVTANVMAKDKDVYLSIGISDCIGKPFTAQELWRCLLKYLKPVTWQKEDAVQRDQADNELRQKLINCFVKTNRGRLDEIKDAIHKNDIKLAHRLAHSLKSNAGQLDRMLLQRAARDVELSLRDGNNLVTSRQMETLETELSAVIAELEPLVHEPDWFAAIEPLDSAAARELLEKVEPMLKKGNPECLLFIDDLKVIPGSEEMIRQMDDFNFKQALAILLELKKKM
ncbi:MAG: response regulator [Treponema sp.]|nr:response regulator [Treponema sp.]